MLKFTRRMKSVAKDIMVGALDPALVKRAMKKRTAPARRFAFVGMENLEPRQMLSGTNPVGADNTVSTNEDIIYMFSTSDFGFDDSADAVPGTFKSIQIGVSTAAGKLENNGNAVNATDIVFAIDIASGLLTFTPDPDDNGTGYASFTFSVIDSDDEEDSTPNTMTIDVTAVNDEPSFTVGLDETVDEDSGTAGAHTVPAWITTSSVGPADEVAEPQTLTYSVSNDNNALFQTQPAVDSTGQLTYTLAADAYGTTKVTISVSDDGGVLNGGDDTSADQYFNITVNPVNDVPSFTVGLDETVDEDSGAHTVTGWITTSSVGPANEAAEPQTLTYTLTNDNNALFSVQPAVDAAGELTYKLAADAFGSAKVTINVKDDGGVLFGGVDKSGDQYFNITVDPVADTASITNLTVNEDALSAALAGLVVTEAAVDGAEVTKFQVTNLTSNGTLYLADGTTVVPNNSYVSDTDAYAGFRFKANSDLNSSAFFGLTFSFDVQGYTVENGLGGTPVTATITVNPVNDEPTYATTGDADAFPHIGKNLDELEDSGPHTILALITAEDVQGGQAAADDETDEPQVMQYYAGNLTFVGSGHNFGANPFVSQGTSDDSGVTTHIDFSVNGSGDLTYQVKPNWYGTWTFTIEALDTGGTANGGDNTADSDGTTFTLTISPVADKAVVVVPQQFEHTLSDTSIGVSTSKEGAPITINPAANDFDFYDPSFVPDSSTNDLSSIDDSTVYYEISNVTNGVLYYNDDPESGATIIIQPGDPPVYITVGDGRTVAAGSTFPGLRFLPDPNLYNEKGDLFGFDIHTTLDGTSGGFDGPTVTHPSEPASSAVHVNIPVARKPDFVSDVELFVNPVNVTPGQKVFANVSYQNSTDVRSFPQTIKIYRSSDGTLATLDALLYSGIIPGVNAHNGWVQPVSWTASVADSGADNVNVPSTPLDGTGSNYLIAILDEEHHTGDSTDDNNWAVTLLPIYTVTVPDVTVVAVSDGFEGVADSGQFRFTRTGDTSLPLTVSLAWNNSLYGQTAPATLPIDFVDDSYPPTSITFEAGSDTVAINVSPKTDNITEGDESLLVRVLPDSATPPTYLSGGGYGSEDEINIVDVLNTVSIRATDNRAAENRSDRATFRISRGKGEDASLPIVVAVDFTGILATASDSDFAVQLAIGNTTVTPVLFTSTYLITIPARRSFTDFRIVPVDDALIEGTEVVNPYVVGNPGVGYIPGTSDNATASILDNDDINLTGTVFATSQTVTTPTNSGGKFLHFSVLVTNNGTSDAPSSIMQYGLMSTAYTTTPGNYDLHIIPAPFFTVRPLRAGASYTKHITVRLSNTGPLATGTYYVATKADLTNAIAESDENDNYGFSAGVITVSP